MLSPPLSLLFCQLDYLQLNLVESLLVNQAENLENHRQISHRVLLLISLQEIRHCSLEVNQPKFLNHSQLMRHHDNPLGHLLGNRHDNLFAALPYSRVLDQVCCLHLNQLFSPLHDRL